MKWFRVCEEPHPELVSVDNHGASDFIVMKTVLGGYGYLPTKFFNELVSYEENGVIEFNYKISPSEYRRGVVTKSYKPFYSVTPFYIVRYYILLGIAWIHNYFAKIINKIIEQRAMTSEQAMEALLEGKTVGWLTHVGCARQWWWKFENNKLYTGRWSNNPKTVPEWEVWDEELPRYCRYKVAP